jgi:hypothetical protein
LPHIKSYLFSFCSSVKSITIPCHVQILCSYCLSYCNSLSRSPFETDSELPRVESNAFSSCYSLKSVTISRRVQILCSYCFSYCELPSSISFDTESDLARIEVDAFYSTSLSSVLVPQNTSFVTGGAFPHKCVVRYGRRRCRMQ